MSETIEDSEQNVLWDTPGNPRWQSESAVAMKKSKGVILCFSPSEPNSFQEALSMVDNYDKPFVIAATKADIAPFHIRDEWSSEARVRNVKIIRTSAANGGGVSHVFKEIFSLVDDEEIVLTSLEYTTQQIGSCINYSVDYLK
jgi:signal recognition particle receptor subunit beta